MASSANLGALNQEWVDLANKVGGLFYSPGSATDVAARRAQNGQDGSVAEQPTAPPTVVGQTPAAPAAPGARTSAEIDKTIANTPIDTAPAVPANKYDDVVAAAVAKSANKFSDLAMPGYANIGASVPVATPVAAPVAPAVKAPTINAPLMEQQQNLMAQIAAAQQVVAAGSNRDGYKMGDVTKALMTMNHLSPLVASTNSLLGNMYGTDAGMINHATDNATRVSIADAGNATEMAKTNLAGQYGIQGRALDNEAAVNLAERKAAIDAASPASQVQAVEAATKARILKDTEGLTGVGRAMATQGKYNIDQVKDGMTGDMLGAFVNGVYVPAAALGVQSPAPATKKK